MIVAAILVQPAGQHVVGKSRPILYCCVTILFIVSYNKCCIDRGVTWGLDWRSNRILLEQIYAERGVQLQMGFSNQSGLFENQSGRFSNQMGFSNQSQPLPVCRLGIT